MNVPDRSKQMNLINEDLARGHPGVRRRWRGAASLTEQRLADQEARDRSVRLDLARLTYIGR